MYKVIVALGSGVLVAVALLVPTIVYMVLMNLYEKYLEKGGK